MDLQQRISQLVQLGNYILQNDEEWQQVKEQAYRQNPWFIPVFVEEATANIANAFLAKDKLEAWAQLYHIPDQQAGPQTIGIVMAGNIPLVGFHDFLAVFITGHNAVIKPSSKDEVLIKHLVRKLYEWDIEIQNIVSFAGILKNCDAYIATGSNNSGRYFDYYFAKYPHIIRKNRTSVAVIDGTETKEALDLLAEDMQLYFGLGCRNVTKLYVPEGYDFIPLLQALKKYDHYLDFHKYKHNFDYHLAILIMNGKMYMNSGAVILTEDRSVFSPISRVHYELYANKDVLLQQLQHNPDIQCIVSAEHIPFGSAQHPSLNDYADGADTLSFLLQL